jgi:flagellar hook-length control protein FliK
VENAQIEYADMPKWFTGTLEEFIYASALGHEMGIDTPELEVLFYSFIGELLKNGVITAQDLKETLKSEKTEPSPIRAILEDIWEAVKNDDKPKKEELLLTLKNMTQPSEQKPEGARQSEGAKQSDGVKQSEGAKQSDGAQQSDGAKQSDGVKQSEGVKQTESVKQTTGQPAATHQQAAPVQPEIRAVWEGADLKIEIVNPKTGEKLHSVPAQYSHGMQERINEFEVVRQIVAQAKFITTPAGEQRMTIHLSPEHLGQVDLRISLNNSEMQIHARVESGVAQTALENHIGLLREGLEKQGITLERLEVSVEQRENRETYAFLQERENQRHEDRNRRRRGKQNLHLAVSTAKNENSDTGRRLGYNTMEYLA